MELHRITRRTLSDEVFERLSAEIVEGRVAPGMALPAERALVERLGVNRGAVREALRRLAQAGLVSIQQGGATRVLDFRRSAGLDLLSRLLLRSDGEVDLQVARGIIEMRAALAPDIARLCARRAGRDVADRLFGIVAAMEAAEADLATLQTLSMAFWEELVRGAANIAYELAFNTLKETYERIREALTQVMADELRDHRSYRSIAQSVARGDDLAARHVAGALIEKGTHRVLVFIAVLEPRGAPQRERGGGV